jgi:hypothetical protein
MWLTSLSPASYLEKVDQFGGGGPFDGGLRYDVQYNCMIIFNFFNDERSSLFNSFFKVSYYILFLRV